MIHHTFGVVVYAYMGSHLCLIFQNWNVDWLPDHPTSEDCVAMNREGFYRTVPCDTPTEAMLACTADPVTGENDIFPLFAWLICDNNRLLQIIVTSITIMIIGVYCVAFCV